MVRESSIYLSHGARDVTGPDAQKIGDKLCSLETRYSECIQGVKNRHRCSFVDPIVTNKLADAALSCQKDKLAFLKKIEPCLDKLADLGGKARNSGVQYNFQKA